MPVKFLFLAETRALAERLASGPLPCSWPIPDEIFGRSYGCAIIGHRFDRVFLALPTRCWLASERNALGFAHFLIHARTFVKPDGEFHIL